MVGEGRRRPRELRRSARAGTPGRPVPGPTEGRGRRSRRSRHSSRRAGDPGGSGRPARTRRSRSERPTYSWCPHSPRDGSLDGSRIELHHGVLFAVPGQPSKKRFHPSSITAFRQESILHVKTLVNFLSEESAPIASREPVFQPISASPARSLEPGKNVSPLAGMRQPKLGIKTGGFPTSCSCLEYQWPENAVAVVPARLRRPRRALPAACSSEQIGRKGMDLSDMRTFLARTAIDHRGSRDIIRRCLSRGVCRPFNLWSSSSTRMIRLRSRK